MEVVTLLFEVYKAAAAKGDQARLCTVCDHAAACMAAAAESPAHFIYKSPRVPSRRFFATRAAATTNPTKCATRVVVAQDDKLPLHYAAENGASLEVVNLLLGSDTGLASTSDKVPC